MLLDEIYIDLDLLHKSLINPCDKCFEKYKGCKAGCECDGCDDYCKFVTLENNIHKVYKLYKLMNQYIHKKGEFKEMLLNNYLNENE